MFFLTFACALFAIVNCVTDDELLKKYEELSLEDYVEYFNNQNYSWKAQVPKEKFYAGTIIDYDGIHKLPIIDQEEYNMTKAPEFFDSRTNWVACQSIGQVFDQGQCGSCWAYSSATMISDRICIHLQKSVQISVQDFECCPYCFSGNVCNSGFVDQAFQYWQSQGVVSASCKQYNIATLMQGQCHQVCQNGANYNSDKHYGSSIRRIGNSEAIKAEISRNGPVVGGFPLYSDFYLYKTGVYQPKGTNSGTGHAVKVVGYGVENGLPYWLIVNTWPNWGQYGIGKIMQNSPLLNFEESMVTGLPKN